MVKVSKIITVLLIICLIYANFNLAISGVISYALEEKMEEMSATQDNKQKELNIKISDFNKNTMHENETEYTETLTLNLNYEEIFNEVKISDVVTEEGDVVIATENTKVITSILDTYYKSTKVVKSELKDVFKTGGSVRIKYMLEEHEKEITPQGNTAIPTETLTNTPSEELIPGIDEKTFEDIEKTATGTIIAKEGIVVIDENTITDENDFVTILYPENTNHVEIEILGQTQKINEVNIENNKIIKRQDNAQDIQSLEIVKKINVKGETELLNKYEKVIAPVYYTKTVAELGIDKTQMSTSVPNKVNFTITMHTDRLIHDLYKNPYFIIELPNEVKTVNVNNVIILNNKCFEIAYVEAGSIENGNIAIAIKLNGEQLESTKSIEENTQIVVEATVTTNGLLPTLQEEVKLHYQNEKTKTYDGIGVQTNGFNSVPVEFISNKEIIVESKAIVGEKETIALKERYTSVDVEPNTYTEVKISGTAINNMGQDIINAKILGSATNIGPIAGVETVYYTENENATIDIEDENNKWYQEYMTNAKKYLIIVDDFKQAQTLNFKYDMVLSENIEENIKHEAIFEVYNENNEIIKTSKIIINQKAKENNTFNDINIQANIAINNTEKVKVGDYIQGVINIANTSGRELNEATIEINTPKSLEIESFDSIRIATKEGTKYNLLDNNDSITLQANLLENETITLEFDARVLEYIPNENNIQATIRYDDKETEIFTLLNIEEPSKLETTIISDKIGKELEEGEKINYTITVKNTGEFCAEADIQIPQLENINITGIEIYNPTTGKTKTMSSTKLNGITSRIKVNPEETVEIRLEGIVNKVLNQTIETMYMDITGDNVYDVSTQKISNYLNKKIVKEQQTNMEEVNTIKGIAWIDKNENGQKDNDETLLRNIQAILIDTETLEQIDTKTTNNKGEYRFKGIEQGNYIVEFKYNTNTFTVTDYTKQSNIENPNSNVINTTQNNITTAKTEVITVEEGTIENINVGFVVNKDFDMAINKGINKVTVSNSDGTKNYEFDNSSMAKVEINGKHIKGSIILIEYEIEVTNMGDVEGYVKNISDKIPEGIKFSSELNTAWYEGKDGQIYCEALKDKKLQPGETEKVKLILTKEMTDDKVVAPVSTAHIQETFNDYLIEDKNKENNSSEATIIISLTTGKQQTYIWIILMLTTIICLGNLIATKKIHKYINKINM